MLHWEDVHEFWFGPLNEQGWVEAPRNRFWFGPDKTRDKAMRRRFQSYLLLASENGLEEWKRQAPGWLALILLLDQFPRNIYRASALAFEFDVQATKLAKDGIEQGKDVNLTAVERAFFYMPFQHSEKLADQTLGLELYRQLHASYRGPVQEQLASFVNSAEQHRALIERFGRFPHRNKVLKRPSSLEEQAYLVETQRTFGQ